MSRFLVVLLFVLPLLQVSCSKKKRDSECERLARNLKKCDRKSSTQKISVLAVDCEQAKKRNNGKLSGLYNCVKNAGNSCRRVENCINVKVKRHLKNNKVIIRKSIEGKSRAGSLKPVIKQKTTIKPKLNVKKSKI